MRELQRKKMIIKKSEAVSKFEFAMSNVFENALKKSVVKTLVDVKEPIFNKELKADKINDFIANWYKLTGHHPSSDALISNTSKQNQQYSKSK